MHTYKICKKILIGPISYHQSKKTSRYSQRWMFFLLKCLQELRTSLTYSLKALDTMLKKLLLPQYLEHFVLLYKYTVGNHHLHHCNENDFLAGIISKKICGWRGMYRCFAISQCNCSSVNNHGSFFIPSTKIPYYKSIACAGESITYLTKILGYKGTI